MISIAEAISDLLFVRDTVVVPGFGAFVKKPTSAHVNPVANYFAMPSCEIVFDANLREDNDLVVGYMAEKNDIPDDEARRLLAMFVSDCFNSLKQKKNVVLNHIGTLSYDWAGDLVFEQDKSVNYNADAFGLCDFSPVPVIRSKSKDEIKEEIERQQKDKNTPVTVDEKAVHKNDVQDDIDDEEELGHRFGWLWIMLGVLLMAAIVYGLHYFQIVDLGWWESTFKRPAINIKPGTYKLPSYTVDWDEELAKAKAKKAAEAKETVKTAEADTVASSIDNRADNQVDIQQGVSGKNTESIAEEPAVERPAVETSVGNIRIVAGCFAQEENAARLANALKDKGYTMAFYELRGSKWYVSFGRYATDEEATAALREIRTNTEYKAWILK